MNTSHVQSESNDVDDEIIVVKLYFFNCMKIFCRIKSLYILMGRELEDIEEAVAGNIIGKLFVF